MEPQKKEFKNTKFYKIGRIILNSSSFAMLLSLGIFWIQKIESDRTNEDLVNNLTHIEESLSTNYIGIFPEFLPYINAMLKETKPVGIHNKPDTIIIFEDVLYYGLGSAPEEFEIMINELLRLSNEGHHITIAYYGVDTKMFLEEVQEARIDEKYITQIPLERRKLLRDTTWRQDLMWNKNKPMARLHLADSIVSEKFFQKTKSENFDDFCAVVAKFKKPLYQEGDDKLFREIDEIRQRTLNKPEKDISFADFYTMYREVTLAIANRLTSIYNSQFEFVELNNYLVMSCWSNSERMLFALPGQYAANEIGFVSRDQKIQEYIKRQLDGIKAYGH